MIVIFIFYRVLCRFSLLVFESEWLSVSRYHPQSGLHVHTSHNITPRLDSDMYIPGMLRGQLNTLW
jgi:hypothetical protein